jgi:hypothetical protein
MADGPPAAAPPGLRWRRRPDRRRVLDALCVALVAAALVAAVAGLWSEQAAAARQVAKVKATPLDHGVLVVNRRWAAWAGFAEFARHHIPSNEPVLVVQQARNVRGAQRFCRRDVIIFDHFWMLYSLAPRPDTCNPAARWTVYLGVVPGPLPKGTHAYAYRPDLVVVRRDGGP